MGASASTELQDLVRRVREVRRWMVWLICARTAAVCLAFLALYVLAFSLLDHWLQLAPALRLVAFVVLICGVVVALVLFGRALRQFYSTRQAANLIEHRYRFEQQLATAIEYYEDRDDYPYSKVLAERVVGQAAVAARDVDFTGAVPKWQAYTSVAVIAVGLVITLAALWSHGAYFSRYFTRLAQPLAAVAPLSATQLEAITGDLLVPAEQSVEVAARVTGNAPETGTLEVTIEGDDGAFARHSESRVSPVETEEDTRLAVVTTLPVGRFQYRFRADEAATAWQTITVATLPDVKSIEATIRPGPNVEAYTQEVREYALDVPEGAEVELAVELTEPVAAVSVAGMDGTVSDATPVDSTHVQYAFQATQEGMLRVSLTSAEGLENTNVPPLQVTLREDTGPEFALKSPNSDYLATNVASIPIAMEVRDDRGLRDAALIVEIPGREPLRVEAPVDGNTQATVLTHTLELEEYDLALGDSILYHAEAEDVPAAGGGEGERTASDIYFIEIKPYRQIWHQLPTSLPSEFGKPGLEGQESYASLLAMLEYARAILKKTWSIAASASLSASDASKLDAILNDVRHAEEQADGLSGILQLSDSQRASLREVRADYASAALSLANKEPKQAIPPEKSAYQTLRAIVLELEKGILSGGGSSPRDRDRLRLEEQVHLTRFEQEEEAWQLERLANQVAQLRDEQQQLQEQFENFLKDYGKQESIAQPTTDESSWLDPNARSQESESSSGGGVSEESRVSMEGAIAPPQSGSGSAPATQQSRKASAQERLDVLRAVQRSLEERAAALRATLDARGSGDVSAAEAAEHLGEAAAAMGAFDSALTEAMYSADPGDALQRAETALSGSIQALNAAAFALEQAALLTAQEEAAKQLLGQAERMADLAEALEATKDGRRREELLEQLQKAIVAFQEQGGPNYVGHFDGTGTPPGYISLAHSVVGEVDKSKLSDWTDTTPERTALWLAAQYSTMALNVEKQRGALRPGEQSDSSFSPTENVFYEEAAHFDGRMRR